MAIPRYAIALGTILALSPLGAQVRNRRAFQQTMDEPPVPPDPLELVTGNAQPVEDVSHRAEIIDLVTNARRHSNVRAQPYDLKTTFTGHALIGFGRDLATGGHVARGILPMDGARAQLFDRKSVFQPDFVQQSGATLPATATHSSS